MFLIKGLALTFILILIIIGAVYTATYEKAPVWERIQIFAVGFGMYCGIIGSMYLGV